MLCYCEAKNNGGYGCLGIRSRRNHEQKFRGERTPDTFREEGVVWEGGGTGRAMGAAGVEKGPQGEIRLES